MAHSPSRILCLGRNVLSRELRWANSGKDGLPCPDCVIPEAYQLLQTAKFDLEIASTRFAEEHRTDLEAAMPIGTQVLLLDGVTFPVD